jgi:uncharacterized membrane protein
LAKAGNARGRTLWELNDVLLFWRNALDLVDCLDILLDALLVIHDADAPIHSPGNANAPAVPKRRYAAGEITSVKYEERRAKLLRDTNVKSG